MRRAYLSRIGGGFTMLELLITLLLIAGLIAFVFPVLARQIETLGAPRLANDLSTIRTAIQVFNGNTRVYPNDIEDLVHRPSSTAGPPAAGDRPLASSHYTQAEIGRWRGPYLDLSLPNDDANSTPGLSDDSQDLVGSVGRIESVFVCLDGAPGTVPNPAGCTPGDSWAAIQVNEITPEEFEVLNTDFDPAEVAGHDTHGRLRYRSDWQSAFVLVAPI